MYHALTLASEEYSRHTPVGVFHQRACNMRYLPIIFFRSTHSYSTGSHTSFKNTELIKPPLTTMASGFCTSAPAQVARAIGTKPKLVASAVISTGRRRVAKENKNFSTAKEITEHAGEHFDNGSRRFGNALDQSNSYDTRSQRRYQEHRKHAVHQLRRHIHEQADEAKRPDRPWNSMKPTAH